MSCETITIKPSVSVVQIHTQGFTVRPVQVVSVARIEPLVMRVVVRPQRVEVIKVGTCGSAPAEQTDTVEAGEDLLSGDLIAHGADGLAYRAHSAYADDLWQLRGVAAHDAATGQNVQLLITQGLQRVLKFASALDPSDLGRRVFVSETPGRATLTPPTTPGNAIVSIGHVDDHVTPYVQWSPQLITIRR